MPFIMFLFASGLTVVLMLYGFRNRGEILALASVRYAFGKPAARLRKQF
ncbi:MAG: hypothetical protein KDK08_11400 [Rhizobiaceae bacterium]|nr:hypothetical protein [Pseudooceanicola sediminis]MCB1467722.1 hypothetical protein [Rhizobiaceae bacterium]